MEHSDNTAGRRLLARRLFSVLAAWLLCVFVTLLAGLAVVRLTLCSPGFLERQIRDCGYGALAQQELQDDYRSYGAAGGFDGDTMLGLLDGRDVEADMMAAAAMLYEDEPRSPDYSHLEDEMYAALMDNVAARNIRPNEEIETGVRTLAQTCAASYAGRGVIPFLDSLHPVIAAVRRVTPWALTGLAAGAAVCLWLLAALHRNRRASLAYITQGLTGAALLLCAAAPVLHWLVPIRSLNLQPASLKALLAGYVTALFDAVWPFAAVVAVMAALCGGLYALSGRK